MQQKMKTGIKIGALCLSVLLLICLIIAGMVVLPQLREQGKRYQETTEFKNREQDTQMIAHRGLSGLALENTKEAFLAAAQRTYYGIETDVRITKDGKFILCHDETLERIAGLGYKVEDTDYETLKALTFSDPYAKGETKTCSLASLAEYFSICQEFGKRAMLELKSEFSQEKIVELVGEIEETGYLEHTTFLSFSKDNLLKLRQAYPSVSAQYFVEKCTKEDEKFMIDNKMDAGLCWVSVTRSRVKRLHKAGLKVNAWTVDGAACATLLQDYGVDQITTNILE
jgi:glycerophosphoryl diester phosphodiesterase